MRFEVGRIDHHSLFLTVISGQTGHHRSEDTPVTPPLPTVVERLMRPVFQGCVAPTQAVAIDKDNAAQDPSIIHTRLAMGLGEEGLKARHLRLRQPEKIRHVYRSFFEM